MSYTSVPVAWRRTIEELAKHQCEYCQTQSILLGMPLQIDHIIPQMDGGATELDNLCLACPRCNQYKGSQTTGWDDVAQTDVSLFHPRQQKWPEHFQWSADGLWLEGQTAIGRVTITTLQMNNSFILRARQLWVDWKYHPPHQ